MTQSIGITSGLMAGCCAALSYLFSRHFQSGEGRSARQLMALSSAWMALFSLIFLPFFYCVPEKGWSSTALALLGVVGGYGAGMSLLFGLLKRASSSSITPILGLKILVLALVGILNGGQFSLFQWLAIVLVMLSSALLKDAKEGLSWFEVLWAFGACCCYAASDSCIQILIRCINSQGGIDASITATIYSYLGAGIFSLLGYKHLQQAKWPEWRSASGFACSWYAHMVFLYLAIASIGTVYSVVLQATRSLWAVVLGLFLAKVGYHALERDIRLSMRVRQLIAASLTVTAILFFSSGF